MKNKRGQFYLIAAIVIIALIMGLIFIGNSVKSKRNDLVQDISIELKIESDKNLDNGALSGVYNWDEFTANFSNYVSGVEIIYIVGNIGSYKVYKYDNGVQNTSMISSLNADILTVTYDGSDYEFKLRQGQNFYYLITQSIGGEKYVARN